MIITKTKDYSQLSLSETKEDLRISDEDLMYDGQIKRYLKDAASIAENYIDDDILPTVAVLEESSYLFPLVYLDYSIKQRVNSISAITLTMNNVTTVLSPSEYNIEKNNNFTKIQFKTSITANVMKIYFQSGYSSIPLSIKRAISIQAGYLFDVDRNNTMSNQISYSKTFERLLSPYVNIIY